MISHFGDRLIDAVRKKNVPACVGIDPLIERLPQSLLADHGVSPQTGGDPSQNEDLVRAAEAMEAYGREIIRVVAQHVPVVKINIAFFEPYGSAGINAYEQLIVCARAEGLIVIGDVKRADIGHSSQRYADAHLGRHSALGEGNSDSPDAVTVNPYFGFDGVGPFVERARGTGGGLFVLVQTSNESAAEVQGLALSGGGTLCERIAELVQTWAVADGLVGSRGYSCIGAVVSPRDVASTRRIRTLMPNCIFLVPGFGAQGRTPEEAMECFSSSGDGAIVTASRSVIYAYEDDRYRDQSGGDWRRCVDLACRDLVDAVRMSVSNR